MESNDERNTNFFYFDFNFLLKFAVGQKVANADEVTWATYLDALESGELVDIPALSQGDKQPLNSLLFVPEGAGPFPAMVALHGAGGIFPYQAWWARQMANTGVVVLFLDSYCTRGHLCEHSTGDNDKRRGAIMRKWDSISIGDVPISVEIRGAGVAG